MRRVAARAAIFVSRASRVSMISGSRWAWARIASTMRRRSRGLGQDGAVAVPDLDDADDLERDEGLAQGRAADAETLRELALGGQPVARREAVGLDPRTDLLGDLLVEPGSREAGQPRC